jgi:DmsE family decaheme c-type cytochrome
MSLSAITRRTPLPFSLRWLGIVAFVVASVGLLAAARPAGQDKDAETCGVCHEDLVMAFAQKPHTVIGEKSCTSCHGSAEKHLEEQNKSGVFAFRSSDLPQDKSAKCLTCHSKDNPQYAVSPHAKAALDCTTCHSVHGDTAPALLKTGVNKNCAVCHQDVFAQFQTNERHRLQEGVMTCTTCHDPHEPATRSRLAGFKQEQCISCRRLHRLSRGPRLTQPPHADPPEHRGLVLQLSRHGRLLACLLLLPGHQLRHLPCHYPRLEPGQKIPEIGGQR